MYLHYLDSSILMLGYELLEQLHVGMLSICLLIGIAYSGMNGIRMWRNV